MTGNSGKQRAVSHNLMLELPTKRTESAGKVFLASHRSNSAMAFSHLLLGLPGAQVLPIKQRVVRTAKKIQSFFKCIDVIVRFLF